jgi:hypothetical protein
MFAALNIRSVSAKKILYPAKSYVELRLSIITCWRSLSGNISSVESRYALPFIFCPNLKTENFINLGIVDGARRMCVI